MFWGWGEGGTIYDSLKPSGAICTGVRRARGKGEKGCWRVGWNGGEWAGQSFPIVSYIVEARQHVDFSVCGYDAFFRNASHDGPRHQSGRQPDQMGYEVGRKGVPKRVTKRCPEVCIESLCFCVVFCPYCGRCVCTGPCF